MITIKNEVTALSLQKLRTKTPENVGNYWKGIPHHIFLDIITNAILLKKWEINDVRIALSKDNQNMSICLKLILPDIRTNNFDFAIGFVTSNARHFSTKFYFGIIDEDDIGIVLDKIYEGRHTKGFDLSKEIYHILADYKAAVDKVKDKIKELVDIKLTYEDFKTIMFKTAKEENIMTWSRIGQVTKLSVSSTPFTNAWHLYKVFCEVAGKSPVFKNPYSLGQMEMMYQFKKILLKLKNKEK